MAGDTLRAPDDADSDRFDALRQALSGLLSRFTADRDVLITTVQECEQRLEEIAARIEAGQTNGRRTTEAPVASAIPELDDLRRAIDQVQLEQRQAEACTQATAQQAIARADEALRRIETLAAAAASNDGSSEALLARFTADRDALRATTREFEQQLAAIAKRLNDGQELLNQLFQRTESRLEQLESNHGAAEAEASTIAEHAMARADDALAKIEALTAALPDREADLHNELAGLVEERTALTDAIEDCKRRLAVISARVEVSPTTTDLTEIKGLIELLQRNQQQAAFQQRTAGEGAMAQAAAVLRRIEDLAGARDGTTRELEALRTTVRGLAADLDRLAKQAEAAASAGPPATKEAVSALTQRVDRLHAEMRELRHSAEQVRKEQRQSPVPVAQPRSAPATSVQAPHGAGRLWRRRSIVAAGLGLAVLGAVVTARWMTPAPPSSVVTPTAAPQSGLPDVQAPAQSVNDSPAAEPAALPPPEGASQERTAEGAFATGLEALGRGDMPAAEVAFGELIKLQPDSAEARNNLAVVLTEQGRIPEATDSLRRALESRPDYDRARVNLERLQALLAAQQPGSPQVKPTLEIAASVQEPKAAPPVELAQARPAEAPPIEAPPAPVSAPSPSAPAAIVALEPQGATACVVEPANNRLCVYRGTAGGIAADACYAISAAQIRAWPQWVVPIDVTPQRIRLVDEIGRRRLTVVPEGTSASGELVRLAQRDFDALSSKVVPGRTSWVVLDGPSIAIGDSEVAAMRSALEHWRQAWETKQLDAYVGFYGASFSPQSEPDIAHWRARKRSLFERSGAIAVQITAPSIFLVNQGNTAFTSFEQSYRSAVTTSRDFKVLRWQRERGRWSIGAETVLEAQPHAQSD